MSFFDKIKTSFDDDNEVKTEEVNKTTTEKKPDEKIQEKSELKTENSVKKSSAPNAINSDWSTSSKVEDDFMAALNQNIIKSDKPKENQNKTETNKKPDEKSENIIEIKKQEKNTNQDNNSIFKDQIEEKSKKDDTIKNSKSISTEESKIKSDISWKAKISIDEILDLAIENGVSDIHFSEWSKVALRINWSIRFINEIEELDKDSINEYVNTLLCNDEDLIKTYTSTKEMDCAYEHSSWTNFRVNLFFKRKKMAAVLRKIESKAMKIEELWIPLSIKELLKKNQWLLLVTWPTWSWKSTSMQSMLQFINETRVEHILTIEDPVEFIFKDDKSIFSQREVWSDTKSFQNALKAALREDPDIIMIWEMRDQETINAAMHLAETGHLVISTLHTSSAAQTVSRLVSTYPSDEQDQVQSRLADALIWVLSQRLVKTLDWKWRIWLFEVLIVNTAVRSIIRTWDMWQMWNAMLSWRSQWMVRMIDYADDLASDWKISQECYQWFFKSE